MTMMAMSVDCCFGERSELLEIRIRGVKGVNDLT